MRKILKVNGEKPVMLFKQEDLKGLIDCICNNDMYFVMSKTIADLHITDEAEQRLLTETVVDNLKLYLNSYINNFNIEFENMETFEQEFDRTTKRIKEFSEKEIKNGKTTNNS